MQCLVLWTSPFPTSPLPHAMAMGVAGSPVPVHWVPTPSRPLAWGALPICPCPRLTQPLQRTLAQSSDNGLGRPPPRFCANEPHSGLKESCCTALSAAHTQNTVPGPLDHPPSPLSCPPTCSPPTTSPTTAPTSYLYAHKQLPQPQPPPRPDPGPTPSRRTAHTDATPPSGARRPRLAVVVA